MRNKRPGKWALPDNKIPKTGWKCYQIEDLGDLDFVCEMCEYQPIRYLHYLKHEDYPIPLIAGCICTGELTEDIKSAKEREKFLKRIASRRKNWLGLKSWKFSRNNYLKMTVKGAFTIGVFPKGRGYRAYISDGASGEVRFGKLIHPTEEAAQLALFDKLVKLEILP